MKLYASYLQTLFGFVIVTLYYTLHKGDVIMKNKLEKLLREKKRLEQKEKKIIEKSFSSIGKRVLEAFRQDKEQMKFEHIPELCEELIDLDAILPGRRKRKVQQEDNSHEHDHGHDQGD